jgi:hypothetical protein
VAKLLKQMNIGGKTALALAVYTISKGGIRLGMNSLVLNKKK